MPTPLSTAALALARPAAAGHPVQFSIPNPIGWLGSLFGAGASKVIGWIVQGVTDALNAFFGGLVKAALDPLLKLLGQTLLTTPELSKLPNLSGLWDNSRQIAVAVYALIILVAGILVMAYETVQTRHSIKEIAPRIVIGFIAANMSLLLAGKAVAFANALSTGVLSGGVDPKSAASTLTTLVMNAVTNGGIFLIFIGLALACVLVALLVCYVIRVALTIILIAGAPLALMCHALPQTEGIARWWWRAFAGVLAIQLAQSLTLVAALRVFLAPGGFTFFGPTLGGLVDLIVTLALLYILFKIPFWILGSIKAGGGRSFIGSAIKGVIAYKTLGALGLRGGAGGGAGRGGPRPGPGGGLGGGPGQAGGPRRRGPAGGSGAVGAVGTTRRATTRATTAQRAGSARRTSATTSRAGNGRTAAAGSTEHRRSSVTGGQRPAPRLATAPCVTTGGVSGRPVAPAMRTAPTVTGPHPDTRPAAPAQRNSSASQRASIASPVPSHALPQVGSPEPTYAPAAAPPPPVLTTPTLPAFHEDDDETEARPSAVLMGTPPVGSIPPSLAAPSEEPAPSPSAAPDHSGSAVGTPTSTAVSPPTLAAPRPPSQRTATAQPRLAAPSIPARRPPVDLPGRPATPGRTASSAGRPPVVTPNPRTTAGSPNATVARRQAAARPPAASNPAAPPPQVRREARLAPPPPAAVIPTSPPRRANPTPDSGAAAADLSSEKRTVEGGEAA